MKEDSSQIQKQGVPRLENLGLVKRKSYRKLVYLTLSVFIVFSILTIIVSYFYSTRQQTTKVPLYEDIVAYFCGTSLPSVCIRNLDTGKVQVFTVKPDYNWVSFSPDGKYLYVSSAQTPASESSQLLVTYSVQTKKITGKTSIAYSTAYPPIPNFSPDKKYFILSGDATMLLNEEGKMLNDNVLGSDLLFWSPDSRMFITKVLEDNGGEFTSNFLHTPATQFEQSTIYLYKINGSRLTKINLFPNLNTAQFTPVAFTSNQEIVYEKQVCKNCQKSASAWADITTSYYKKDLLTNQDTQIANPKSLLQRIDPHYQNISLPDWAMIAPDKKWLVYMHWLNEQKICSYASNLVNGQNILLSCDGIYPYIISKKITR